MTRTMVLLLAILATLGGLFGGPPLGDHETLVAQVSRDMRLSGDWIVPRFLETTFIRKPPLPYWLVGGSSYLLPPDRATGLPVTEVAARLPSALAALGTVLLLWKLGSGMFGRAAGVVAALLGSASVFVLLYAVNATVEMLLTFCCTWAGAHLWYAARARTTQARFVHSLLFYFALGVGMLAKGPAPLAMVGVPLAIWWYLEKPQRLLASGGPLVVKRAAVCFLRGLISRTIQAFTRLWFFPGVFIFLMVFVPWMMSVAREQPHAWRLWNWQYLQRFQGDYEDTRDRGPLYYVPIVLGLLLLWTLAFGHALAAPWIQRYRAHRRALFFAGVWAVVGVAAMSAMKFKKPYYILPALPPFILLMTPVVMDFVRRAADSAIGARKLWNGVIAVSAAAPVVAYLVARHSQPDLAWPVLLTGMIAAVGGIWAVVSYLRGRIVVSIYRLAVTTVGAFLCGWYGVAPSLSNFERVTLLDRQLRAAGVPTDAPIVWADQRPDARLRFYYLWKSAHLIDPAEIVKQVVERKKSDATLQQMATERANVLLTGSEPAYLVIDREHLVLLDDLEPHLRSRIQNLTIVDVDGIPDGDDWVVVTNMPADDRTKAVDPNT